MTLTPARSMPSTQSAAADQAWLGEDGSPTRLTRVRLWLPLTPLFWLAAPLTLVLAPLLVLCAPKKYRVNPYIAALALGRLLLALSGLRIDVETDHARIHITIV